MLQLQRHRVPHLARVLRCANRKPAVDPFLMDSPSHPLLPGSAVAPADQPVRDSESDAAAATPFDLDLDFGPEPPAKRVCIPTGGLALAACSALSTFADKETVHVILLWSRPDASSRVLLRHVSGAATANISAAFSACLNAKLPSAGKMAAVQALLKPVLFNQDDQAPFPSAIVSLSNASGKFFVLSTSDGRQADTWRLRLSRSFGGETIDAQWLGYAQLGLLDALKLSHPALLLFAAFTLDRVRQEPLLQFCGDHCATEWSAPALDFNAGWFTVTRPAASASPFCLIEFAKSALIDIKASATAPHSFLHNHGLLVLGVDTNTTDLEHNILFAVEESADVVVMMGWNRHSSAAPAVLVDRHGDVLVDEFLSSATNWCDEDESDYRCIGRRAADVVRQFDSGYHLLASRPFALQVEEVGSALQPVKVHTVYVLATVTSLSMAQELEEEVSFSAWLPVGHLPLIRDTLPSGAPSRFAFMKQVCAKALQMMHAEDADAMHVGNPRDLAPDLIWNLEHDPLPREQAEYALAIDLSGPDINPRANAGAAAAVAPPKVAGAPLSTAPTLVTPDHDTHQLQRQLLGTLQDSDGNTILTIDTLAKETSWDHAHRVVAGLRALKGALANARGARHKEHTPALTKAIAALDKSFLSAKRSEIKGTDAVPLTHVRSLLIHCFKTMQQCTRANGLVRQLSSSPHSVRDADIMHVAVGKMRAVLKDLRVLPYVVGIVAVQGSGKTTVIEILQKSFQANDSKVVFYRENHENFMPPLRAYLAAMARSAPLRELQALSHKVQLAVLDAAHQGLSDVGVAGPGAVVERLTTCVMAFGLTALKNGHLTMAQFFNLADTVEKVGFLPSCIWWVDEDPEVCLARVKSRAQADPTRTHEASSGLQYLCDLAVAHEIVYGHVSMRSRCTVWTDRLPLMGCKDKYKDTVCRIFGTRIRLHLEAVAAARSFGGTDIFAPVEAEALP